MPIFSVSFKKVQLLPSQSLGYWTILTKLAHDVATILPLNIFYSELPYYYPACRMKVILPILSKIDCHGNVSWGIGKTRPD